MRDTERDRDIGRGRGRLPAGSLMQDWIPGPQDHDLSQRQMLNTEPLRRPTGNVNVFIYLSIYSFTKPLLSCLKCLSIKLSLPKMNKKILFLHSEYSVELEK